MVHILTGTNDFARSDALSKLMSTFVAEHGDIALERLDGEEATFNQVLGAVTSLPFLSTKKMVVLRVAGANKELSERIGEIFEQTSDTTELVLVEGKLDKRLGYYKTLKAQKSFKDFTELDENSLSRWLVEAAKEREGELSISDARYLVERSGASQQMLSSELDKLLLLGNKVTREKITTMIDRSPHGTVFELLDAAFAGNIKRALELYAEQRQQRVEPQAILALISWQLHILALIKVAGQRSPSEIAREGGVSPYVVNKSISTAKHLTTGKIKDLVLGALTLDIRLKSEPLDPDTALQTFLLRLA